MTEEQTPRSRADRAIDELVAGGVAVTVQAVRERAGVSNAVATQAARAWKSAADRGSAEVQVVPAALVSRSQTALDALWVEARTLAAAAFDAQRAEFEQQLAAAEDAAASVSDQVEELAGELGWLRSSAAAELEQVSSNAAATVSAMEDELAQARSRADRAEGALEVLAAERDRLLSELRELRDGSVTGGSHGKRPA